MYASVSVGAEVGSVGKEWAFLQFKSLGDVDLLFTEQVFYLKGVRSCFIIHHKEYLDTGHINDPNVTLNWENLERYARTAQQEHHGSGEGNREGV